MKLKLLALFLLTILIILFGPKLFLRLTQAVYDYDSCEKAGFPTRPLNCQNCPKYCDAPFGVRYSQRQGSENLKNKIMFNGTKVWVGTSFKFNPSNDCVGDNTATLTAVDKDSIAIDITEQESFNHSYFPVTPVRKEVIANGTCLSAIPLCTDVSYKYCFVLDKSGVIPSYTY